MWIGGIRAAQDSRAHQRPLVRIELPLDHQSDWRTATFTPRHRGPHAIVLESSNPKARPSRGLFGGAIEVEVRNPHGRVIYQRSVDGQAIEHPVPSGTVTTVIGVFDVPDSAREIWAATARVVRGDRRFAAALSTLQIGPPAELNVGWHIFGRVLGVGALAIIGLLLLIGGGSLARSQHRKPGATGKQ